MKDEGSIDVSYCMEKNGRHHRAGMRIKTGYVVTFLRIVLILYNFCSRHRQKTCCIKKYFDINSINCLTVRPRSVISS